MAKKKKCPECAAGEKWAVPYADFLSLLLALFIALWAISSTSPEKAKALKEAFIIIFDYPISMPLPSPVDQDSGNYQGNDADESSPSSGHISEPSIPSDIQADIGGVLEQIDSGTFLRLPSQILFEAGVAEITNSDNFTYLERLVTIIKAYPEYVHLDVRGYTDDSPLPVGSPYKDQYALSSARAINVMNELVQKGIQPHRISISGYGPYDPIVPNDTPQNRARNNRVEIFFFVSKNNDSKIQSLLEKQNQ